MKEGMQFEFQKWEGTGNTFVMINALEWDIEEQAIEDFKNTEPADFKTLNLKKILRVLNSVAEEEFKPTLIAALNLQFDLEK